MEVSTRFNALLDNVRLTEVQREDGQIKHAGVRSCLNSYYYNWSSSTANSFLVGSWGKCTQVRPPRDVDVMFELPTHVYTRYQTVSGNKQSQILQEVKRILQASYPDTIMRADGQIVMVPFWTYNVEVVPAFKLNNGQYYICDTNSGGRYKQVDPQAEIAHVQQSNNETKGNTRDLIRMVKRWQEYCGVPMKSFWLELIAVDFLNTWEYRGNSSVYYDWMVRDFFRLLDRKGKSGFSWVIVPGTYESISLGTEWASRAESARVRAEKACDYDNGTTRYPYHAGEEWQKIFGDFIPKY